MRHVCAAEHVGVVRVAQLVESGRGDIREGERRRCARQHAGTALHARPVQHGASELAGDHAALHEEVVYAVYLCAHEWWVGHAQEQSLWGASAHLVMREELASEVECSCQLRKTRAATSWMESLREVLREIEGTLSTTKPKKHAAHCAT